MPNNEQINNSSDNEFPVLVIDDDKWIQKLCKKILSDNGFTVMEAEDPYSGLEKIIDKKPLSVLLDLNLPNLNGSFILNIIKNMNMTKDISIVILSAGLDRNTIKSAHEMGVSGFIAKPFNEEVLIEKVLNSLPPEIKTKLKEKGTINEKYFT